MRFSYVMLPDYPLEESLRAIKLADELGFYACYAADETGTRTCGCSSRPRRRDTTNIRFGPSCLGWSCVSPRLSPRRRRPSTSSPTVAPRWSSDQATSACCPSTTSTGHDQAAVPGQGGRPGDPDLARRRRHHVRRRVLQVPRAVHVRTAGPGAVARQDGVHAWPEVVRGRW